jgi:AraC-like DNA-binding protein
MLLQYVTLTQAFAQLQESDVAQPLSKAEIDSIETILPRLQGAEKLEALRKLTDLTYDDTTQIHYINRLLDEARRQQNIPAEGDALYKLTYYYGIFDTQTLYSIIDDILRFLREHKLYDDLFAVYKNRIVQYDMRGQVLTAFRLAEEAYAEAKESQDKKAIALILRAWGALYENRDQPHEALRLYEESLLLSLQNRKAGEGLMVVYTYNDLISVMRQLEQYDEALRYADSMRVELDRYVLHCPDDNMHSDYFGEACHRVCIYAAMNDTMSALRELRRAELLFEPQWNETILVTWLNESYAAYYFALEQYDKALPYLRHSLQYFRENNIVSGIGEEILHADAYAGKKDYQTAAELYRGIINRKDSINREQLTVQLNELRTIYELDKAELEALRRQETIRRQRLYLIGSTTACLALAVIAALIAWSRKRITEKNRGLFRQIKEQDRLADELKRLSLLYDRETLLDASWQEHATPQLQTGVNGNRQQREIVARLQEFLLCDRNYANPNIEMADLALQLGTNRTYLFEALKTVTGHPVQEYINNLRTEEAKRLLETTDIPITVIAEMCGFNSVRTFYRRFFERYNMPPAEYRKLANVHT